MRDLINLIERQLTELERGGAIESDVLDDINRHDFSNRQLDLFKEIPSLEPNVPDGYKTVGRIGAFYVIKKTEKLIEPEEDMLVVIDKDKAIAWLCLLPTNSKNVNHPQRLYSLEASLNGIGRQVIGVYVDRAYAGQRIGQKMYKWALENVCDYIVSDETHTRGGEALWRSFIKSKEFDVEIFDPDDYESRQARGGKNWDRLYTSEKQWRRVPWMTLRGKSYQIRSGEEE